MQFDRTETGLLFKVDSRLRHDGFAKVSRQRILEMAKRVERSIQKQNIDRRQEAFSAAVGPRYAGCSFDSFNAALPEQKAVLDAMTAYASNAVENVQTGSGLLLLGSAGTGKDHLMCAAARTAINENIDVRWVNGRDLFGQFRDLMDTNSDTTEADVIDDLTTVAILAVSDLLPVSGSLSPYQADILFRILDARYRHLRPVWATLNVGSSGEADTRMGAQIIDRLRDAALVARCNWPSYRKARILVTTEAKAVTEIPLTTSPQIT